jgi:serine/threonine protein kinase/DNA polymerase III delta prime subunit
LIFPKSTVNVVKIKAKLLIKMTPKLLSNRYRIIQGLGRGGFGETFLAEDTHLPSSRICVIKQLKPITNKPHVYQLVQERFAREAAILEQLGEGHEQIPNLYAYFRDSEHFYLVQEWVEGVTLNEKLKNQGIFKEDLVKEILINILKILDFIHTKGIIHRDIKPSNIIWRQKDSQPVLIDFGIAKEIMNTSVDIQGEVMTSVAFGTPGFMPPEQAIGKPVFSSDIYSLGMTMIYLLTGKHPQEFENNLQNGEIIWQKETNISTQLFAILDKAIKSYSQERYATAKDMLADLADVYPQDNVLQKTLSSRETINPYEIETALLPIFTAKQTPKQTTKETASLAKKTYSKQGYNNRQILLNKVKNYWVKGVLETSLHGIALIELGLENRLDSLDRPWGMLWETLEQARQPLPQKTKIIDLFQQMGEGRTLLILGEPGAGKTTTLLELTRDLITLAEEDTNQRIPVIFNLSAWTNEKIKIAEWLIRELNSKYQVSKEIGKNLIKNQQLLLLLDGLDEISVERRDTCVEAINKFSQIYGETEIVVCSRIKDYEALSNRLRFQGAVFIQPLTLEQIHQYLNSAGSELAAVKIALQADSTIQELAKSPLMLSIMTIAYQGLSVTELPGMNLEERRQHLFDKYIQRMFDRRGVINKYSQYSQKQSMEWLAWLAQRLKQQSQTVFLIERIQPDWLQSNRQKYIYGIIVWLTFIILGLVISEGFFARSRQIILLIYSGLVFWAIFGVYRIRTVENLKWSWQKGINNIIRGITVGSILGLLVKVLYELLFHPLHWRIFDPKFLNIQLYSWTRGIAFGLSLGLVYGLIGGLTAPSISIQTVANQGIWQSVKNAIIFGFIGLIVLGISARALGWFSFFWGMYGLWFGVAAGGGEASIKHLILRIILCYKGYIPWNYARFLNYATERIFLQKVGGGYIFVHRLLLEHFAQKSSKDS